MKGLSSVIIKLFLVPLLFIMACNSKEEKPSKQLFNKFHDHNIQQIYEAKDKRDSKALTAYFNDENPTYRAEAALAFGSVQDSLIIPQLGLLLDDDNSQVRRAAAFSLGQTYDTAAIKPLASALLKEDSVYVRKELFEALGKVIDQPRIDMFLNLPLKSEADKQGLAWGLYRAGVRNVHNGICIDVAIRLLKENNYDTRLAAAHFLARTRNIDLSGREGAMIHKALNDTAINLRMAAAFALGKSNTPTSLIALKKILKDKDQRVVVSALRALARFDYNQTHESFLNLLNSEHLQVAHTAAQSLKTIDEKFIEKGSYNPAVKPILLGKLLNVSIPKTEVIAKIVNEFNSTPDAYYKAGLLSALGSSPEAYEFIAEKTFSTDHAAVRSAGIGALINIRNNRNFSSKLAPIFADLFKKAISTADVGIVSMVSGMLTNPDYNFKNHYKDFSFLKAAKEKLNLPKDNEALQALNNAITYFEGKEAAPTKNEFNHPIDWELVKTIRQNSRVTVKTQKGNIILRMLVNEAPGSAANFVQLASSGYFNGKNFHRVVPNFVIQGGCNRGDGYGSEDFSIRSEFSYQKYAEGSVGMASAGKDTEGTQWFITHSPTPHLDGRYTIFAQVEDGMDVVNSIQVGDSILEVVVN